MEKNKKSDYKALLIICSVTFVLFAISLLTNYAGTTDIKDYADTAKLFSGQYQAKLRSNHSLLYGIIFSPLIKLTQSFIFIKLASILWIFLLILSVYYISNKNKKTLLLFIATPIIWYLAPWISPIQLSSLLFLWGYFFIRKYEEKGKLRNLFYSGLFVGLAWAFWDAVVYFAPFLAISFLYNKKLSHFIYFFIFVFIGIAPKLLMDQILFSFAFFGILRYFLACVSSLFYGGIYGQTMYYSPIRTIIVLLFFPFYSYLLFSKNILKKYKKTIIFLVLSLLLIIMNSQPRFTLMVVPIIILILGDVLNKKKFKIQILIFLVLTLLVINPYILQIKYDTNIKEFRDLMTNFPNFQLSSEFKDDLILQDLRQIGKEYPNQMFIVGNNRDDYRTLAHIYWGKDIKEFISIEDYELYLENETTIASKTFCSASQIRSRRDICMSIELRKAINDPTDYGSIEYALSLDKQFKLENFRLIKNYRILSIYEKIKNL